MARLLDVVLDHLPDWNLAEWALWLFVTAVSVAIVGSACHTITHPDYNFIRECAQHRPLADCKLDAKELYK